jgi:hypothetical protein
VRGGPATVCEGWGVRAGLAGEDGLHREGTLHGSSLPIYPGGLTSGTKRTGMVRC